MRFVVAIAIALLTAFIFTKAIKKAPLALYAICIAADLVYAYGLLNGIGSGFWAFFLPLMQRCTVAMAFLTLVMFIGALKDGSAIKARLMPIRRQLSIAGCLLAFCHIIYYAWIYIMQIVMFIGALKDGSAIKARLMPIRRQLSIAGCLLAFCHIIYYAWIYIMQIQGILGATTVRPGLAANLFVALGISVLVTALLVILLVTSFMFVKSHMHAATWKKVQRFSYVFYALICLHLMMILVPPALAGKTAAAECVIVYAVVFGAYAIMRTRRHLLDKKAGAQAENAHA